MQHNKTSLKFLFCGRSKMPKCLCTGLHIKKCSWARYFILTVPLSTPRSINGYCQRVREYRGNRKGWWGLEVGGYFEMDYHPIHGWEEILFVTLGHGKHKMLLYLWTALVRRLISFKFVFCNQFLLISPPLFPFQHCEWPQRWKGQHDGCISAYL